MLEPPDDHPDRLLHRDISEKIIGSAFEVYNEFGYGFLERVYERSMQVELINRGSAAEIEKRIQVQYKKGDRRRL
jgi:GxxExxY protein